VEQIYTIPVNEAFENGAADKNLGCPVCAIHRKLEDHELELILGDSMMEPAIRIKTNKKGFCHIHYDMMFIRKNRLGMALTLESHLNELRTEIEEGFLGQGKKPITRIGNLEESCYICEKLNYHFDRVMDTIIYLWEKEESFREKFSKQHYFCLPHYRRLLINAKNRLSKKQFAEFFKEIERIELAYFDTLCEDVSWFCKKFDYRYENEPWHNSKDAVERAIKFLRSDLH
jgi:hypothetical protein